MGEESEGKRLHSECVGAQHKSENGELRLENAEWRMENCELRFGFESGKWKAESRK